MDAVDGVALMTDADVDYGDADSDSVEEPELAVSYTETQTENIYTISNVQNVKFSFIYWEEK